MWPSGQSTRAPCAGAGNQTSARVRPPNKEFFQTVPTHDKQGDNPGQAKEGLTVSSINGDHC